MIIYRIRDIEEWRQHVNFMQKEYEYRKSFEENLQKDILKNNNWTFTAYSYPSKEIVQFHIEKPKQIIKDNKFLNFFKFKKNSKENFSINWRESLICPKTKLNNRIRAAIQLFEIECNYYSGNYIYLTEQITPTYQYFKKNYLNVTGSEYFGKNIQGGKEINNIRHEDITNLSFEDNHFEHILSFDVFEHIPNYLKGFKECFRTLKKGGSILWSVPFIINSKKNIKRAEIDKKGKIKFLLKPEYHGDPVGKNQVLCFYHFGWDLLKEVKDIGFNDVYALLYWSNDFGYLGFEQILFVAFK